MPNEQLSLRARCGRDHPLAVGNREGHRFFTKHMLSCPQGLAGDLRVQRWGQGDIDQVELRILEHRVEIIVGGHPREVHLLAGRTKVSLDRAPIARQSPAVLLTDCRHLHAPHLLVRKVVDHAHEAETGDSYANHKTKIPLCCKRNK